MSSEDEHQSQKEVQSYRELRILQELEGYPESSQRELSQRLGIALGLTNAILRNMGRKGFVRATQASWRRWLYAITPEGFSHKLHLTVTYVRRVLDDYKEVKSGLRSELSYLSLHSESRIALYGTGELAELVFLALKHLGIEDIDIFGTDVASNPRFLSLPVREISFLASDYYDKVIIADFIDSIDTVELIKHRGVSGDKIVIFFSSTNKPAPQLSLNFDDESQRVP